ncbi:MAG: alcohol dehydrogenase catalytic domain-containing protein [Clostridiaceae bacterium]|nr:alcohol dehydrogenase catalytic domain-containing protein [Clostridiaceae bacterium]
MKVKALYVKDYMELEHGVMELNDELKADEVLVKTKACGICTWDSTLYQGVNIPGPYPFTLGHEGVGVVEKVGSLVTDFKPGDNVFTGRGGSGTDQFAEYYINKDKGLWKLPDGDIDNWASVVYEPTCCVVNALNAIDIQMGDHVVLVAAGYMGLQTIMGLANASQAGEITVFEPNSDRIELAKKYLGSDTVYNPLSDEGKAVIKAIQDKGGADVVIEFGGNAATFALSDSLTKAAGKLAIAGFHRDNVEFYGPKWHLGGLTVYNVAPDINKYFMLEIPSRTFTMIQKGVYKPAELVTHVADFEDLAKVKEIFDRSVDKKDDYMKGVVLF